MSEKKKGAFCDNDQHDDYWPMNGAIQRAKRYIKNLEAERDTLKAELAEAIRVKDKAYLVARDADSSQKDAIFRIINAIKTITTLKAENKSLSSQVAGLVASITKVLNDEESGTGWGPDITTVSYLKEAIANTKSTSQAFEKRIRMDERELWARAFGNVIGILSDSNPLIPGLKQARADLRLGPLPLDGKATQAESEATGDGK